MKKKNMNETEKILYALNILKANSKDETKKEEFKSLIEELELKMGKSNIVVEEDETKEEGE